MDWNTLLSTLGLIFVAELGDKTQLAVVTQTCRYRCPLPVFFGASLALSLVTAIGVIGGQALLVLLPEGTVQTAAAVAFVVMGALIWRQSTRLTHEEPDSAEACTDADMTPVAGSRRALWNRQAFVTTVMLLMAAELGDKTQLAVVALVGSQADPLSVLAGGALALTAVSALGVLGGQQLCRLIPEQQLLRISAALFVAMGGLMAMGIL
jgi:putative Ca2+/H+ antiporter (TMEM165/GDT1 family)